ncbi:MAG: pyroglutamyl-peptidase I [Candidatus Spyradocola sp.]
MMKVLLTGFAPFGGDESNPSWEAVKRVQAHRGAEVRAEELPVTFAGAGKRVTELLAEYKPDFVIMVGLAAGRKGFTVERVALNLADARIPDNEGAQPVDTPVDSSGPAAIFTNVDAKRIVETLRGQGLEAALSYSAGTYVCNHAYYTVLRYIQQHMLPTKAVFVHVPCEAEQAAAHSLPGMALADMVRGLQSIVDDL